MSGSSDAGAREPNRSEAEETIVFGAGANDTSMSPEELRRLIALPADEKFSNYRNAHAIGMGGIGMVYSAEEPGLRRKVALKVLRPQYRFNRQRIESFIREAEITARIDHPNVVPVHRVGVFDDSGIYFSMKRVAGQTLRVILLKLAEDAPGFRRRYTLRRLVNIFLACCNAVAFAHHKGIIHGDLKPGNIMIGEFGEIFVLDWGMAQSFGDAPLAGDGGDNEQAPGGTPVFMAPERLCGEEKRLTAASDIYALGATLYSILTWRSAPFDHELPQEQIARLAAGSEYPLPRRIAPRSQPVPRELEAICLKAMASRRDRRYQTVNELIADLRNYLDGYPVSAYSPGTTYHVTKWLYRNYLVPVVLMAAVATWFGVESYSSYVQRTENDAALLRLESSFAQGNGHAAVALRLNRKMQEQSADQEEVRLLRERMHIEMDKMSGCYDAALNQITMLPEKLRSVPRITAVAGKIFNTYALTLLRTREQQRLEQTGGQLPRRYRDLYYRARLRDSAFNELAGLLERREGKLTLVVPAGSWSWRLLDRNARPVFVSGTPVGGKLEVAPAENLCTLPAGTYVMEFCGAVDTLRYRVPLQLPAGSDLVFTLENPRSIPPGMVYVAGNVVHERQSAPPPGVPPFLISRNEITFAEYLRFWSGLDATGREACGGFATPDAFPQHPQRLWDDNGRLAAPLRAALPVTGITPRAAEAFCHALSQHSGRNVRLPRAAEWDKAFNGGLSDRFSWGNLYEPLRANLADARIGHSTEPGSFRGDLSPYGVCDMTGNVREFLAPAPGESTYGIAGGSYLMSPDQCVRFFRQLAGGSARDVGFRIVTDPP